MNDQRNSTMPKPNDDQRPGKLDAQRKEDEVLPPEDIGNVTSGLAETPERPEPANGDCPPADEADR